MTAYRRHFIRLNMLLVGAVLLITLTLVGAYMLRSEYANIRQTLLETLEPFRGENGSFSYTQTVQPDAQRRPEDAPPDVPDDASAFGRCITVFIENGEKNIISGRGEQNDSDIFDAVDAALGEADDFGYLRKFDLFYLNSGRDDSAKVSLYPARYLRASVLKTAAYLLAAFALTMLACYFISRYISKIAVRPVEQAMAREKQFVADVSHDLKTPLAVMRACNHILMENPDGEDAAPWLERSAAAVQNMQSLIDDMLTLSAMDAAQRLPCREMVKLSGVVTKAALQMEAMAYDRGIQLETDVQADICVMGDADALLRVVSGLIENAFKYEPENGRIRVALAARGKRAALTVQNFGACVAPEDLPHIFERFYRGDKARTAQQGHGLGLAIIRRTVELMDGKIEVSSASDIGTIFTVTMERASI